MSVLPLMIHYSAINPSTLSRRFHIFVYRAISISVAGSLDRRPRRVHPSTVQIRIKNGGLAYSDFQCSGFTSGASARWFRHQMGHLVYETVCFTTGNLTISRSSATECWQRVNHLSDVTADKLWYLMRWTAVVVTTGNRCIFDCTKQWENCQEDWANRSETRRDRNPATIDRFQI